MGSPRSEFGTLHRHPSEDKDMSKDVGAAEQVRNAFPKAP
jgi:hypothetical protein